jgi:hypothetical protein
MNRAVSEILSGVPVSCSVARIAFKPVTIAIVSQIINFP